ncbi:acetamidase/formamidase family protein [Azospirillum sp. ST 5-10]|uniref:acetamidase/formamidase family protein n=1 Tax=unclassified Azospirillum TaxID=2630922 RepID=UPI003F4A83DB
MSASPLHLNVDSFPAAGRRAAWDAALAALSLRCLAAGDEVGGAIRLKRSSSGARLALVSGSPQRQGPGGEPTADAPFLLLLVLKGRGSLRAGTRLLEFADGDLVVLDLGVPWQLGWRQDFDAVFLELPRPSLAVRLGRSRVPLPLVLGSTVAAQSAKALLRVLAGSVDTVEQACLGAVETAVTELAVSALLSEARAPDGAMTQVQAAHFRRVAAAIDSRLSEPELALCDVARAVGMSVRYLQRLFERRQESFSSYVRRRRLDRCKGELQDPNHARESVAEIALRWGFANQAHFSRAFSAAFGVPPRAVRSAAPPPASYPLRGNPGPLRAIPGGASRAPRHQGAAGAGPAAAAAAADRDHPGPPEPAAPPAGSHHLPARPGTVHWGYLSRHLPPVLRVRSGATVRVETLTQHGGDDYERMIAGDPAAESVFAWTREGKAVDRRGAGPMDGRVFGRGAGEGFGVHICTGPIHVRDAEPGDVLEVEILDLWPRPSGNPAFAGKAFASNASAWWGFQYNDPLHDAPRREVVTIYEIDLAEPGFARALHSYRWTPQTDPFGVVHERIDYPGVVVDPATVARTGGVLEGVRVPARPHFGFIGVAPREADMVDSIPPGYFGGNIDNWRAGKGARLFLPVAVEGALLSVGDGHFAQADGEVNGTGLECSLTGDLRIRLHKQGRHAEPHLRGLKTPLIETPTHWVVQSFSFENYLRDLGRPAQTEVYKRSTVDLALRNAFRQARRFLMDVYGLAEDEALSLMSLAVDFGVTQVADGNVGVHAVIDKAIFAGRRR